MVILGLDILIQPWLAAPVIRLSEIAYYRDLALKVHFAGEVIGEPDVRSDGQNLIVEARKIFLPQGSVQKDVHGKVMVKARRYPEFLYGDILDISCKLQTPPVFEKFSYAALLAKDDIFALCTQPNIRVEKGGENNGGATGGLGVPSGMRAFWTGIFTFKSRMITRINELYSEPAASLVAGILVGQRRSIPQKILDDFNTAGLTHVLAISGYNVSMMITVFGYLCKRAARRWRYAGMFGGVLGLVVLTGFSASVLRAAWMGCIALLAQALGRKGSAMHLLLVSAVIMVIMSPRMMLVDLSFQLSFLSTLGILLFMPKIEAFEQKFTAKPRFAWISKIPPFMREGFCVTMAAQVFTTPLLFYQFGRFSLIAPVANIFVLPLVPWIMLFSFCGLAVSFLIPILGRFISFSAYVLVMVMLFLVDLFAHIPFAAFHF